MLDKFERDGFWIEEGVLQPSECDELIEHLNQSAENRSRAGIRNLMAVPEISTIANDRRLIDITNRMFGQPLIPFKATLFEKSGKANWLVAWHQDTTIPVEKPVHGNGWGPASIKEGITFVHAPASILSKILAIRIHLDASIESNGPLRVIPGTHKRRHSDEEIGRISATRNQEICTVGKGGVVAMSPLLVHASSKCFTDAPRRVLHLEYATSMAIAQDVNLAVA